MTRRYYHGPISDHWDGTRFFNPGQPDTDRSLRDLLHWKFRNTAQTWPSSIPVTPVCPEPRVNGLRITMVGHATLLIQVARVNILTDPVWSERVSPVSFAGPRRVTAPGIPMPTCPSLMPCLSATATTTIWIWQRCGACTPITRR